MPSLSALSHWIDSGLSLLKHSIWPAVPQQSRLPLELFYNVFDAVAEVNDVTTLLSCSRLSHATSRHARSLLFKNVSISTREAFFAFEDVLTQSRDQDYARLVSALSISLNFNSPYGLTESHLARLVTLCPNLRTISISVFGCEPVFSQNPQVLSVKDRPAPSLGDTTLRVLAQSTGITSLEVANWSDNAEILLQLLRVWPRVKRLSVSGTIPCIPMPITEPLVFKDLESLSITAQTPPFLVVLQRLLFDALGTSLRELHLGPETDSELMDRLTLPNLASVQILSLPSYDTRVRDLLKKCISLRRVKIEHSALSEDINDALSDSIETVAFGIESPRQLETLLRLIPNHQRLRTICICPRLAIDCEALRRLCRSRGIEFIVCRTNKQFEDF